MTKQTKITRSAEGQDCMVRIPGVCNFNPETTVLAHLGGGGTGMKNPDWQGAYCCSDCHDMVDGRSGMVSFELMKRYHLEGVIRTQALLIEQGLLEIK